MRGTRLAIVAGLAAVTLVGCAPVARPPAPPPPVQLPAVVVAHKSVAPPVAEPPARVDPVAGLPVIEPRTVVHGLLGLDGLTPQRAADGWVTAALTADAPAYADRRSAPVAVLPATTLDVPTIVPVLDSTPGGWLRVLVATRGAIPSQDPAEVNERTVWIRAEDTTPARTTWSIRISTAGQTITVDDGTGPVVYPVKATGAEQTPTPKGLSFVVGTFWDEPGSYTPRVILLSNQSPTIDAYDKRTDTSANAIHTSTLTRTGQVSNGCTRLTDDVMDVLWHKVPAGTVVTTT